MALKRTKSNVLGRRIVILSLSLVLAISIVLTTATLVNITGISRRNLQTTTELTMRSINMGIHNTILPAMNLTENVSALAPKVESQAELEAILVSLLPGVSSVFEIYYGTAASRFNGGSFITATDWEPYTTNPEWDQIKRPWFITAMQNPGKTVITDPYEDSSTGKTCVSMVRTSNEDGRIVGVAGTDVFLDVLTGIVVNERITSDGNTFIIDKSGLILVHKNTSLVMAANYFEGAGKTLRDNFSQQKGFSESGVYVKIEGDAYWAAMPISGLDWYIVTTGSTFELNDDFRRLLNITIILGIAMALIAITISFRFSLYITRPITQMFGILKTIAAGDLTQSLIIKGKDEICTMSILLKETQDSIRNLVINIKKEASALHKIGDELAGNMNGTAAAMNEITANIQGIENRISSQNASVIETNVTMDKVVTNINHLSNDIGNQGQYVSQASSAIEQMVENTRSVTETLVKNTENVKTMMESSEAGRYGLQEVVADIQEISRESEGLLEINSVMENIASQTNLLSMNAAIEAAHAGETGKGFAVVADEIRKLSVSSSQQSKTIGTVLKKIKSSIDKISKSTENVLNRFEAIDSSVKIVSEQEGNIRNAMEEQRNESKQTLESVSNVKEITRKVQNDSTEMHNEAKEVIRESKNLESTTREIAESINKMTVGAEQINAAVNHANAICMQNRTKINTLVGEVERFKV